MLHTRTKGSSFALPKGCSIVSSQGTAFTADLHDLVTQVFNNFKYQTQRVVGVTILNTDLFA